jgi:hypothetical protein
MALPYQRGMALDSNTTCPQNARSVVQARVGRLYVELPMFSLDLCEVFSGRIGGATQPRKINQSSSALKNKIAAVTSHATTVVNREFTNPPIFARSLVNCTSGITANGN